MSPSTTKNGKAVMLFRWEHENRGLDHKCGTCSTVLSSPRAKKSCIGTHEFPCAHYHRTLFFEGQGQHCDACRTTKEQRAKRFREIASLVKAITEAAAGADPTPQRSTSGARPDTPPSTDDEDASLTSEAPTSSPDAAAKRPRAALTKKEKKAQKSAAKTSSRASGPISAPSPDDIDRVATLPLLATPTTPSVLEDFEAACLESSRPSARPRIKCTPAEHEKQISAVLAGLDVSGGKEGGGVQVGLVRALRGAVGAHLEIKRNEEEEREVRNGGFWRYVSKRSLEGMVRSEAVVDRETGEKKKGGSEGEGGEGGGEEEVERQISEEEVGEEPAVEFEGVRDERR